MANDGKLTWTFVRRSCRGAWAWVHRTGAGRLSPDCRASARACRSPGPGDGASGPLRRSPRAPGCWSGEVAGHGRTTNAPVKSAAEEASHLHRSGISSSASPERRPTRAAVGHLPHDHSPPADAIHTSHQRQQRYGTTAGARRAGSWTCSRPQRLCRVDFGRLNAAPSQGRCAIPASHAQSHRRADMLLISLRCACTQAAAGRLRYMGFRRLIRQSDTAASPSQPHLNGAGAVCSVSACSPPPGRSRPHVCSAATHSKGSPGMFRRLAVSHDMLLAVQPRMDHGQWPILPSG